MKSARPREFLSHKRQENPKPKTGISREAITQARKVWGPVVTLGELGAGFRQGARAQHNAANLRNRLSQPATPIIDVDDELLIDDLRKQGTPIPNNVVWIAALGIE